MAESTRTEAELEPGSVSQRKLVTQDKMQAVVSGWTSFKASGRSWSRPQDVMWAFVMSGQARWFTWLTNLLTLESPTIAKTRAWAMVRIELKTGSE